MGDAARDRVHLSVDEARELAESSLRGIGYAEDEAAIVAEHVLDAALCGYEYSGLPKLLNVVEHPRQREPHRTMQVVRETDVSILFDLGASAEPTDIARDKDQGKVNQEVRPIEISA